MEEKMYTHHVLIKLLYYCLLKESEGLNNVERESQCFGK